MEDQPTVIYVAGSLEQAHMLKNLLADEGIRAVITNETLSKGTGVDYVGWQTLPRVMVDAKDAAAARQIALKHDRRAVEMAGGESPDDSTAVEGHLVPEAWPRCPGCGSPRITYCPVCKTTGIDFPETDDEYVWGMGLDEPAEERTSSCGSCGACGRHGPPTDGGVDDESVDEATADDETASPRLVLTCPTCSEPFVPEFPRRCAWCGHEFDEGYEPDDIVEPLPQSNGRVVAVAVGLLLLLVAVGIYFAFLM
jgi:hypothetical protein